ncbi:hypothetical protein RA210_U660002 [Rubrivivax sp. A210]|nr:hypothetical protein RA210_U660002 [Rubrivivax sp. A210]
MSGQDTAKEAMNFNLFVGPPRPAFARPGLLLWRGGSKTWHAALASAEREAFFVREQEDSQNSKLSTQCAALPNPSLKWSANGLPPGPGCGALHSPQPGPGGKPSSPT